MSLLEPEQPEAPPALPLSTVLRVAANPFEQPDLHPAQMRQVGVAGFVIGIPLAVVGVVASLALIQFFGSANKLALLPGGYGACMVVIGVYRMVVGQFPVIGRVSVLRMLLLLVLFIAFCVFAFALLVRA